MALVDEITRTFDLEKYANVNLSVFDNHDVLIDSYDIWFDQDVTLYCMQKLCVYEGKIEEIGDTVNYNKVELEKAILLLSQIGILKLDVTGD